MVEGFESLFDRSGYPDIVVDAVCPYSFTWNPLPGGIAYLVDVSPSTARPVGDTGPSMVR